MRYLPYGEERWASGETPTDFGFTSQRAEKSFGLIDYQARFYSPLLGRFVSPDSIVPDPTSSGGFNRYRYARNNPLRYTDPSGHIECEGAVGCNEPPAPPLPGKDPEWDRAVSYDADLSYAAFADGRVHYNQYAANPEAYAGDVIAQGDSEAASYRMGAANVYGEYGLGECLGCVVENRLEGGLAESLYSQGEPLDLFGVGGGSLGAAGGGGAAAAIRGFGRQPGPTIDPRTGVEVGRFIVGPKGNTMIEPIGGSTVPAGRTLPGGVRPDTHTLYPNGSNYQRLNPIGHGNNPTPHAHGHLQGTGPGIRGQGPSLDVQGNVVPWNSPDAHWPIK